MTKIANAIALLDRAHALERHAATHAIRLPRDLARARRALRAALLRATCPDACRLADDLHDQTARLIAQGRSGEVIRARRKAALASVGAYRPETVTPEISEALGALRAAVARAEAMVGERVS
ncbi:hypothetical protein [Ruegeria arenilitoris]|uniref:Uncharacterized protein n=1 Tax=Ruegeria arenilitoris TaxID=1173585 RepID=A0A238K263_9RHOB|nr:hypothetical protein [Ruegeria arenilitoris]SMX36464.1 hypothetical protein RUA8715_01408 [Ruegeria arenilitoris]